MRISVFYDHIINSSAQRGEPVEKILEAVRSFGISALECEKSALGTDISAFGKALARAGLEVSSLYGFFDFPHYEQRDEIKSFIDTAFSVGAGVVLAVPGFVDEGDDKSAAFEKMAEGLEFMCGYAKGSGITVTIEDFDSERAVYSTAEGMLSFTEAVPELKCTFDTGNFIYSGKDELEALDLLKNKISHVHCKDRSLSPQSGVTPSITPAGRELYPSPSGFGCIKMAQCLQRLKKSGYDSTLAIEHFGASDQYGYMKKSAEKIKELWG